MVHTSILIWLIPQGRGYISIVARIQLQTVCARPCRGRPCCR